MYIWLDALFSNFEWYKTLKDLVIKIIILAEISGQAGEVKEAGIIKKQNAIDALEKALEDLGIKIPLPDFIQDILFGLLIDLIVGFLNAKFGHDWIKKVKEIVKFDE